MHIAYIGIGTNIEPRLSRIEQAVDALKTVGKIIRTSSIYETAPFGFTEQSDFLNAVVSLEIETEPVDLHQKLKDLEIILGRNKRERWHEREIDFDLLMFDQEIINTENLTIPHPGIPTRAFVLVPLSEIAATLFHPTLHRMIESLLSDLGSDTSSVHVYSSSKQRPQ